MFAGFSALTLQRIRRFGLWHMVIGRALGVTGVRIAGTRYLTGQASLPDTILQLQRDRRRYHADVPQSLLIESYYAWWMVANHIPNIFPGAKVIGVIRDPRSWIASWQAREPSRDRGNWIHKLPPGPLNAATVGDQKWAARWDEIGQVGRLAWQWQFINGKIAEAEQNAGAKMYRFEDIFFPTGTVLESLCTHLATFQNRIYATRINRALLSKKLNSSAAAANEWLKWSTTEKAIVDELCGPLMERFGYKPLTGSDA